MNILHIIKVRVFGKSLFLALILLLAVNCQKDESADIDADGGHPSTEVSPRQLQNRAREIVNSEEYLKFTDQTDLFLEKIHDENFFTLELFDFDNETYNYDVINERLSGTSFDSAEEFVREYEKAFYSAQKLVTKYQTNLANPLVQQKMREIKKTRKVSRKWSGKCVKDCWDDYFECKDEADEDFENAMIKCTCFLISGPLPTCLCYIIALANNNNAINRCRRTNNRCIKRCNDNLD